MSTEQELKARIAELEQELKAAKAQIAQWHWWRQQVIEGLEEREKEFRLLLSKD